MSCVNANVIGLSAATERGVKNACVEFSTNVVKTLSEKYGFDLEEAMKGLSLDELSVAPKKKSASSSESSPKQKKAERAIPKMVLPFCGVMADWCGALRLNHGLYTQCTNAKPAEGEFCGTCQKQADANANGKPNAGTVADRLAVDPMEYADPKGKKKVVAYANVMAKLDLTREAAIAEAARFGWLIPEVQFELQVKQRGRPKSAPVSEESESAESPKKARGRPRKEKAVASATNLSGEDLMAALAEQSESKESEGMAAADKESKKSEKAHSRAAAAAKKAIEDEAKEARKKEREAAKAKREEEQAAKKKATEAKREAAAAAKAAKEAEKAAKAAAKSPKPASPAPAPVVVAEPVLVAELVEDDESTESAEIEMDDDESAEEDELQAAKAESEEEESEEEAPLKVVPRKHRGVTYYVDEATNIIYNPDDAEVIGVWNVENNKPELD